MLKKLLLTATITYALAAPSAMAQMPPDPSTLGGAPSLGNIVGGALGGLLLQAPQGVRSMRNGLPATTTDSFVYEAGPMRELIYGDEGVEDIPPYFEFTKDHRINQGIFGQREQGLTTGHGSLMPDAWGGDEFVKGPEFSYSGTTYAGAGGPLSGLVSGLTGGVVSPTGSVNVNQALNAIPSGF